MRILKKNENLKRKVEINQKVIGPVTQIIDMLLTKIDLKTFCD